MNKTSMNNNASIIIRKIFTMTAKDVARLDRIKEKRGIASRSEAIRRIVDEVNREC